LTTVRLEINARDAIGLPGDTAREINVLWTVENIQIGDEGCRILARQE
jgi:hypothetical protein